MRADKPDIQKFDQANHDHKSVGQGGVLDAFISQGANKVWASPSGAPGVASFRVLVSGDIPSVDWSKIGSGKPTTLAGYGITDAATSTHNHAGTYQPVDADLTAIAALATTGFAKRTGADTWALDPNVVVNDGGSSKVATIVVLTQAAYTALGSKVATTLYVIVG